MDYNETEVKKIVGTLINQAHDLRTNLNAIEGFCEFARLDITSKNTDAALLDVDKVIYSVHGLKVIIENLLEFSDYARNDAKPTTASIGNVVDSSTSVKGYFPEKVDGDVCVLLAEDNELNSEIIVAILEKVIDGAEVIVAQNGAEAYSLFRNSPEGYFDYILMDVQMPVMNGYDATRAIRLLSRKDANLPIIAITADAFKEDIDAAKQAGMNAHIAKPVDEGELYDLLKSFSA